MSFKFKSLEDLLGDGLLCNHCKLTNYGKSNPITSSCEVNRCESWCEDAYDRYLEENIIMDGLNDNDTVVVSNGHEEATFTAEEYRELLQKDRILIALEYDGLDTWGFDD